MAIVVFNENGHRALDDERQGFGLVAGADDVALGRIAAALAMDQQLVDVLDLGWKG
ncbi:hypothetical protein D3C72_2513320 [compost metagenome]